MAQQEAAIPIKATALSSLKRLLKSNWVMLKITSAAARNTKMLVKIFMMFILACSLNKSVCWVKMFFFSKFRLFLHAKLWGKIKKK